MKKYILALDEGTTSARAVLFDKSGKIVNMVQHELPQAYPLPGFVEHDPAAIFSRQYASLTEVITRTCIRPAEIAAIGITNQRETVVVWDRNTGKPVYNAIVWQCRRTAYLCEQMKADGLEDYVSQTTGLKIDAYFSASKVKWILDNVEGARAKAQNGELLFGTVDCWLLWKLSNGRLHMTDYTNASRTMLFDIHNRVWDKKLLDYFGIPDSMLPKVMPSSGIYGTVNILGASIPVTGIAGDQQAALFGQGCFNSSEAKSTYGTGCFLLMNTGSKAYKSKNGLLTTIAATRQNDGVNYALEGSVFIGGAVIKWLRDELGLIRSSSESEACALKVPDSGGVYIVPAFAGLGAPYWDMYAKGTICGLTSGTGRSHIVRATLESIAYQTEDLLSALRADTGLKIDSLRVDGGASANSFLMQFQADISNIKVIRPPCIESTAAGAAFLAGLAVDFWKDLSEIKGLLQNNTVFSPQFDKERRAKLLSGWKRAVDSAKCFSDSEE